MGALVDHGVLRVHHYTPLHYLPFIARSQRLLCKSLLQAAGFPNWHLRSKSKQQDVDRGFEGYAFLTIDRTPRILSAKLAAGFPHIGISVPSEAIEATDYRLCRYNVAMTRYLRRDGKTGHMESPENGYYVGGHQIPIAVADEDKRSMLSAHLGRGTMIEVLIPGALNLPAETTVLCYSAADAQIASDILTSVNRGWAVNVVLNPGPYNRSDYHAGRVAEFVTRSLAEPC